MEFRTLDEVNRFNARQRQKLIELVQSVTPEQRTWRPASGKWSIAEHFEHVALLMQMLAPVVEQLTAKAPPAAAEAARDVDCLALLVSSGIAEKKLEAPPPLLPQGRSVAESLALLDEHHPRMLTCVGQFSALDTDQMSYDHPTGARLNLAQLWHVVGLHDARHIQHMRDNLEAWEERRRT